MYRVYFHGIESILSTTINHLEQSTFHATKEVHFSRHQGPPAAGINARGLGWHPQQLGQW